MKLFLFLLILLTVKSQSIEDLLPDPDDSSEDVVIHRLLDPNNDTLLPSLVVSRQEDSLIRDLSLGIIGSVQLGGSEPPFHSPTESFHEDEVERALKTKFAADGTEEKLYRLLLDPERYEKDVRPTPNHRIPTNVTFGFLLNQIVEM
ncbi:hypothetical protein PFISCL1PPCAC_24741, partial [Pristionchus fissidentatus]